MSAEDEAAIRDVIRAMAEAFTAHDAALLAQMYSPTADLVTVGGEWFRQRQEIERGLAAIFTTRAWNTTLETQEASIRFLCSDIALAHVKNLLSGLVDATGTELPPQSEFSLRVFVKRDGRWYVEAMHNRRWD